MAKVLKQGTGSSDFKLENFTWPEITGDQSTVDLSGFNNDAGYIATETDPTVSAAIKAITSTQIGNWDTAFSWGNHADAGYLTAVAWGGITGTLSDQTDLQSALDAKLARVEALADILTSNTAEVGQVLGWDGSSFTWLNREVSSTTLNLTSISPTTGDEAGGTAVTLTVENADIGASASVDFGADPATNVVVVSSTEVTCDSPAGTGTVDVTVTQGSRSDTLTGAFEYTASAWTPADHAGTVVWLDAGDTTSITEDGSGNAEIVGNQIAGETDASQSDSTRRPTTGVSLIGGENALGFDGSNDRLEISANPFSTIDDAFVFAVVEVSSISKGTLFSLTGEEGVRFHAHAPWSDGVIYFDVNSSSGSDRISAASGFSAGDKAILSFYSSTTDGVKEVYLNGTLLVSNTSPTSVSTSGALLVGASMSRAQDHLQGEFVVVDGTVSAADRERFEGWGAHKRGLEAKLPSGHPYKSSPP